MRLGGSLSPGAKPKCHLRVQLWSSKLWRYSSWHLAIFVIIKKYSRCTWYELQHTSLKLSFSWNSWIKILLNTVVSRYPICQVADASVVKPKFAQLSFCVRFGSFTCHPQNISKTLLEIPYVSLRFLYNHIVFHPLISYTVYHSCYHSYVYSEKETFE